MRQMWQSLLSKVRPRPNFSGDYWEQRYRTGGTSGAGSYGNNAEAKAAAVNETIVARSIHSVTEFGCGDGNQITYLQVPSYVGLDVSQAAIEMCAERFASDDSKSFFWYSPGHFIDRTGVFKADAALSQEVIFHLVEDDVFETYMTHLFSSADQIVMIWSSDLDWRAGPWERHRKFTPWVKDNLPSWELIDHRASPIPWSPDASGGLISEFFVYERREPRPH